MQLCVLKYTVSFRHKPKIQFSLKNKPSGKQKISGRKFVEKSRFWRTICTKFSSLYTKLKRPHCAYADRNFLLFSLFSFSHKHIRTSTKYLNIIFWYSYIHFLNAAASNLLDQFKLSV